MSATATPASPIKPRIRRTHLLSVLRSGLLLAASRRLARHAVLCRVPELALGGGARVEAHGAQRRRVLLEQLLLVRAARPL